MSISIQLKEEEFEETVKIVNAIHRKNIRITFYIIKEKPKSNYHCKFISKKGIKIRYTTCFVFNELRDLAIESIQTTHFLLTDGDSIISGNNHFIFIIFRNT